MDGQGRFTMVIDYLKAIRIGNLFLLGLLFWGFKGIISSPEYAIDLDFTLLFISILLTAASGYLINDYFDIESDKLNTYKTKSRLGASQLFWLSILNSTIAVLGVFLTDLNSNWIVLIALTNVLLYFYSWVLQHLPLIGNFVVATLCGLVMIVPLIYDHKIDGMWEIEFNLSNINGISWTYTLFAFLLTLLRELIKDGEDIVGDQAVESKTLAVVAGIGPTKLVCLLISLLTIFTIGTISFYELLKEVNFLVTLFPILILSPLIYFLIELKKSKKSTDFSKLSLYLKIVFLGASVWIYLKLLT